MDVVTEVVTVDAVEIGPAEPRDLPAVFGLLREASLPEEGVEEWFGGFLVARAGERVTGAAGMERYGGSGLLRSLVVAAEHRGRGLGALLTRRVLDAAEATGVSRVFLLTETAAEFFPRVGFRRIERAEAEPSVGESAEFQGACPETAVCMVRGAGRGGMMPP